MACTCRFFNAKFLCCFQWQESPLTIFTWLKVFSIDADARSTRMPFNFRHIDFVVFICKLDFSRLRLYNFFFPFTFRKRRGTFYVHCSKSFIFIGRKWPTIREKKSISKMLIFVLKAFSTFGGDVQMDCNVAISPFPRWVIEQCTATWMTHSITVQCDVAY